MLPKVFQFFSDEVIENLFSNIRGIVERECERQEVPPSCSIESEQSVSLDDEELRKSLEEQNSKEIITRLEDMVSFVYRDK